VASSSDDFWPNNGSLDGVEIQLFDPKTLTAQQQAALKEELRDSEEAAHAEHIEVMRSQWSNLPDDPEEFREKFLDPRN
jgi:hypothetical protein